MFNATPQHSYSRVPVEALEEHQKKYPEKPSLYSRVTFGWVAERLSTTDQQSNDGLVPGQRSAWWNYRSLRHAWFKHARSTQTREENPRLWRAVVSFVLAEDFTRLFLFPILILCTRVLQPAMFTALLTFHPFLMHGSPIPWICAVIVGYWLAVSLEGLARSHYAFFAHLTTASVKSGLTGLVYNKVILIQVKRVKLAKNVYRLKRCIGSIFSYRYKFHFICRRTKTDRQRPLGNVKYNLVHRAFPFPPLPVSKGKALGTKLRQVLLKSFPLNGQTLGPISIQLNLDTMLSTINGTTSK